jgi:hypothetical protein
MLADPPLTQRPTGRDSPPQGLYKHHKLSKLLLVPPSGGHAQAEAKKGDLVHGATVRCTYTISTGNGGNFGGRRRGRGFGGLSHRDEMMMLMAHGMLMGRSYGGYSSDGSF